MRNTKREWMPLYGFLDRKRVTDHLSDMAAGGWMLDHLSSWSWRYRRTEPKRLRFAVTFFAGAGRFSPTPAEGLDTFQDYCAQAGWHTAASLDQVQVFYNEDPDAVPIETDPAAELENIRRSVGKPMVRSYLALLLICLLEVAQQCWQLLRDPVDTLVNANGLLSYTAYLPLLVLILASLFSYRRWLRRASAAAEAGLPLPDLRSARGLSVLVIVWSVLLIVGVFASLSRSTGMVLLTMGMLLFLALTCFLADTARKSLQHLRCPPWANVLVMAGICVAMFAGGMAGLFALVMHNAGTGWLEDRPPAETYTYHGMTWSVYHDPIPLRVEDLVEVDYDRWSTEADVDRSPLAVHGTYRQDARLGDGDLPELRYEIVTVQNSFLYDLCKRDFIQWVERDNDQLPEEDWDVYQPVDPAPWGAEEVLQRYRSGEPVNQFLLCWPGRMAEVDLPWDWDLTAGQMALIGETLREA